MASQMTTLTDFKNLPLTLRMHAAAVVLEDASERKGWDANQEWSPRDLIEAAEEMSRAETKRRMDITMLAEQLHIAAKAERLERLNVDWDNADPVMRENYERLAVRLIDAGWARAK